MTVRKYLNYDIEALLNNLLSFLFKVKLSQEIAFWQFHKGTTNNKYKMLKKYLHVAAININRDLGIYSLQKI